MVTVRDTDTLVVTGAWAAYESPIQTLAALHEAVECLILGAVATCRLVETVVLGRVLALDREIPLPRADRVSAAAPPAHVLDVSAVVSIDQEVMVHATVGRL